MDSTEQLDTVVIGAGQAGLSIGYQLQQQGRAFAILDANPRIGDAWRNRWDSLELNTPARFNGLAGLRYPGPGGAPVTKDEFADYLEDYARHFRLPVRLSTRVRRLSRDGDGFVVETSRGTIEARNVVVAMGKYQAVRVPSFASELDPAITQLTLAEYRNPDQFRPGSVLVVGAGDSGAHIAMDVADTHDTSLAGYESAVIPFRIETWIARNVLIRLVRFVGHRVLSVHSPIGRRARPKLLHQAGPLVRFKPKDLERAGVARVGRVEGVRDGQPLLDDGNVAAVDNIVWATGFHPAFQWMDLPVFDDHGDPRHVRGVAQDCPGLYFVGLHFQTSMTSGTVTGVTRDAKHVARQLAKRSATDAGARGRWGARVPATAEA